MHLWVDSFPVSLGFSPLRKKEDTGNELETVEGLNELLSKASLYGQFLDDLEAILLHI